ncbi:MAG: DNA cytosine methyltransferase [Sulfitobacter sp.]
MTNEPKSSVFSFFSGAGLLDLAFEDNSFDVVFVNESFQPFADAYVHSRKVLDHSAPKYGVQNCSIEDFSTDRKAELKMLVTDEKELGNVVGFIGGPPCPDFSVGGKNKGKDGENGRLSQTYIDIVDASNPDWFLFENVKGLWRTKRHRAFYEDLKAKIGKKYHLSERLINSIEAGTPQDRDRILLFGARKKRFKNANIDWNKGLSYPNRSAFDDYEWPNTATFSEDGGSNRPNTLPVELTVQHWFDQNAVLNHPNQKDCFVPRQGLAKFLVVEEGDVSRKSSKRLHRWRFAPTAAYGNNEVHLHPYKARRLTVAEALAIQSMPKNFELPETMSLTNKFKTIGNGVPYLLGKHVSAAISDFLLESIVKKV